MRSFTSPGRGPSTCSDHCSDKLGADGVERHAEYLNRYGNLTLFYFGYNIPASNRSFAEKKDYYRESDVLLTQELVDYDDWNVEAIQQRQDRLARLADEIWAMPMQAPPADGSGPNALERFKEQVGSLWAAVAPYCHEVPASLVQAWSNDLPQHLRGHAVHGRKASELAERLVPLTARWKDLDAHERTVLAGAVGYFLAVDDHEHDESDRGLDDDAEVVSAAERTLT